MILVMLYYLIRTSDGSVIVFLLPSFVIGAFPLCVGSSTYACSYLLATSSVHSLASFIVIGIAIWFGLSFGLS